MGNNLGNKIFGFAESLNNNHEIVRDSYYLVVDDKTQEKSWYVGGRYEHSVSLLHSVMSIKRNKYKH